VGFNDAFETETVDGDMGDNIYISITNGALPFRDNILIKLIGRRFSRVVILVSE